MVVSEDPAGCQIAAMHRLSIAAAWALAACRAENPPPYLGQHASGTPAIFAPGVVSGPRNDLNAAFAPGGGELYFSRKDVADKVATILVTHRIGEHWSAPQRSRR